MLPVSKNNLYKAPIESSSTYLLQYTPKHTRTHTHTHKQMHICSIALQSLNSYFIDYNIVGSGKVLQSVSWRLSNTNNVASWHLLPFIKHVRQVGGGCCNRSWGFSSSLSLGRHLCDFPLYAALRKNEEQEEEEETCAMHRIKVMCKTLDALRNKNK